MKFVGVSALSLYIRLFSFVVARYYSKIRTGPAKIA